MGDAPWGDAAVCGTATRFYGKGDGCCGFRGLAPTATVVTALRAWGEEGAGGLQGARFYAEGREIAERRSGD